MVGGDLEEEDEGSGKDREQDFKKEGGDHGESSVRE